jgi:hypothetical protein
VGVWVVIVSYTTGWAIGCGAGAYAGAAGGGVMSVTVLLEGIPPLRLAQPITLIEINAAVQISFFTGSLL